ncbi:hypothetical protein M8371_15110, partial [Klebsiella pneumoniae]|nr:hypothetical protein [Klebsiella pneumoniae]
MKVVKTIFNFCVPPLQRPGQTCQDRRFVLTLWGEKKMVPPLKGEKKTKIGGSSLPRPASAVPHRP